MTPGLGLVAGINASLRGFGVRRACNSARPTLRRSVGLTQRTLAEHLGMTANYTHTRRETQREQIEQALRRWPASLRYALDRIRRDCELR